VTTRTSTQEWNAFDMRVSDCKRGGRYRGERRTGAAGCTQAADRRRTRLVAVRRRFIVRCAVMVRSVLHRRRATVVSGAQTHGYRRKSAQWYQCEHGENDEKFQLSYHAGPNPSMRIERNRYQLLRAFGPAGSSSP
jgi:hypothetical protein